MLSHRLFFGLHSIFQGKIVFFEPASIGFNQRQKRVILIVIIIKISILSHFCNGKNFAR
ncbi:hypothetical protein SAMN04488109_1845 [Chryseolinea serpens]|uniref:Uncharacterized protein n=1 Tax=Chryseolinea serpens TaxID=947013 RepID=A0A1M5MNJ1_9BACT|nr:hypothetical protein SAMN04488109_1845 [Chryseolinea serpens]